MIRTALSRNGVLVRGAMEALVFRGDGRPFERVAVPQVELGPGELLAEVELATICGSDLHTVAGARSAPAPLVLGHEQLGRVVALGPGRAPRTVDGDELAVGDRIVWGVAVNCGRCRYCRAGLPQKCVTVLKYGHERIVRGWELSGGYATHTHVRAGTPIVRVSDTLPAAMLAPAACATATVMAALAAASDLRPLEGATVAISGCGMLGLTAIAAARAAGAAVVASDPDARRRARARSFGAAAVGDGTADGLRAALAAVGASAGFTVGVEMSGAPAAIGALLGAADLGGVVVLVGSVFPAGVVPLDPELVVRRMLTVRGVHNYAPIHLLEAVRFLETTADRDAFAALVGATHSFDGLELALEQARAGVAARIGLCPPPRPVHRV